MGSGDVSSYADAEATKLRAALTHADLAEAVASYRTAWAALIESTDLLDALEATGRIVLASETLEAKAKHAEATARAAMAQAMAETGCPAVELPHHIVHLGARRASVEIDDPAKIPPHLMRQPEPAPDRTAIGKLLRAGAAVPGARLIGNREPICIFKAKGVD